MRKFKFTALCLAALLSTACATLGFETDHSKSTAYSTDPLQNKPVSDYVNRVVNGLSHFETPEKLGGQALHVLVLKTSRIQAVSVYDAPEVDITRGMLNILSSEAELACLLGHEIGHKVLHRQNQHYSPSTSIKDVFIPQEIAKAKWSQKREEEADEYGSQLCYSAGYDPHAFLGLFERLSQFQRNNWLVALVELSATHKDFHHRASHLKQFLEQQGWQPRAAKLGKKTFINGLSTLQHIRTHDAINELLPGGVSQALENLNKIEEELKAYRIQHKSISPVRFLEIMEEIRSLTRQYGVMASQDDAGLPFMKEELSQDSPLWDDGELATKIQEVLMLLGRMGVGFVPVVGDAIDLYEVLSGQEFVTGRLLTLDERAFTAVGLLAGSGKMWREVASGMEATLKDAALAKRVGRRTVADANHALREAEEIGNTTRRWIHHTPLNPGPLPSDVTRTFRGGTYIAETISKPVVLYRVYSDPSRKFSQYWTRTKPAGQLQATIDSALDPVFKNRATKIVQIRVPTGQTIFEGVTASQRGLVGGGNQVWIEKIDPGWEIP